MSRQGGSARADEVRRGAIPLNAFGRQRHAGARLVDRRDLAGFDACPDRIPDLFGQKDGIIGELHTPLCGEHVDERSGGAAGNVESPRLQIPPREIARGAGRRCPGLAIAAQLETLPDLHG